MCLIDVQEYFERTFSDCVLTFTDGAKDPDSGRAGAAISTPVDESYKEKSNGSCISKPNRYLVLVALKWTEEILTTVTASDRYSALASLKSVNSAVRTDQ